MDFSRLNGWERLVIRSSIIGISFFTALCSPLNALNQVGDFVYIDCTVNPSSIHSYVIQYRVSQRDNDIQTYQRRENSYKTICNWYRCSITEDLIRYETCSECDQSPFPKEMFTDVTVSINRLTGDAYYYSMLGDRVSTSDGVCKQGKSAVVTDRKF